MNSPCASMTPATTRTTCRQPSSTIDTDQKRERCFRQGLHYGGSHPALMVAARPYGFAMPPRVEWRPWAWLVIRAGKLRTRQGRLQYLWVLSCRLGRIQGSIRERVLYI